MISPEDRPGDGAWRRIERLLPLPEELPQAPRDPNTQLHAIPGWQPPMANWIRESIKNAAEKLSARGERGEISIPGVQPKNNVEPRRRKLVTFREVAGDERTDKLIREDDEARKEAHERRMANPVYRRMLHRMTHPLK